MMTDPVADMLTRIRNANTAMHDEVRMPSSKLKEENPEAYEKPERAEEGEEGEGEGGETDANQDGAAEGGDEGQGD